MQRNYNNIAKNVAMTGLFSEYLPPCFQMVRTALCHSPTENCDLVPPYAFTMSRFNGNDARRTIYIPEVGSYSATYSYMKNNDIFRELIEFSEESDTSFSPFLDKTDTIMRHEQSYDASSEDGVDSTYIDNIAKKLIKATGAKKILKLDIANCYGSFYMHMIPAILLGADRAEAEFNKTIRPTNDTPVDPQYTKYAQLDRVIRRQNLNRTNGLLTGTLFSKLIIEAILTRIDKELISEGLCYSRYVDDYEVYIKSEDEQKVINTFLRVLKRYGFSINYEKIVVEDFPYYVVENLSKLFSDSSTGQLQTADLIQLFNTFLTLEKNGLKGAIRFLLKSIEKKPVRTYDEELLKSYLLTILANNERSLTKACSILISRKNILKLSEDDVLLLRQMLKNHISSGHDLEVIWLTYLLLETTALSSDDISLIIESGNELAHTLLFRKKCLSSSQLDIVRSRANSWFLLYELFAADVIDEVAFAKELNIDHNLTMYQKIKERNEHFCK